MTVVVLGIDALDPEIVDPAVHPSLTLDRYEAIGTIVSSAGDPSTHELWPTIITGLAPEDHGLTLEDDGVAAVYGQDLGSEIPQDIKDAIADARQGIIDGDIDVPEEP